MTQRSCGIGLGGIGWALLFVPLMALAQAPPPEAAELALAVAPFEASGPGAGSAPAIVEALREALERRGVGRVVGPQELQLGAQDAGSESAVAAAQRARVGGVVTGRVTQLGSRISVDVRLRSTASGGVLGTYVAEIPIGDALGPAADSLAERLVLGALNLVDLREPGDAATRIGEARDTGRVRQPTAGKPPFAIGDLAGYPLSILADELDATQRDGMRTLVFKESVKVSQKDFGLSARTLSADYLAGEKEPLRLVARGAVNLRQGDREARCESAVYERKADRIVCRGNALLRDGPDEIEGDEIEFDLARRGVEVQGGTILRLHPAGSPRVGEGARLGDHPVDAPMQVRAERLRAEEGPEPEFSRIVLEGGVEVEQSGVTLRSDRLEILYPQRAELPERMEAAGSVSLSQGDRQATCELAIYRAAPHRIECLGGQLSEVRDQVSGDVISFDLDEDRVIVDGRARLRLAGRPGVQAEGAP